MQSIDEAQKDQAETVVTKVVYPSAPWNLQGQLYGSIWTVPVNQFRVELPEEFKPLVNLGRIGVFAGFVDYQPGSILTYHELIAGVVIRRRTSWRLAFNVTHIWVDDAASKQGGRELWGVPKELATFDFKYSRDNQEFKGQAQAGGGLLAQGDFSAWFSLPGKMPVPFPNLQMLNGEPHRSSGTFWSKPGIYRGGMKVGAASPLAALGIAGRPPLISFGGLNFKMHLQAARPVR